MKIIQTSILLLFTLLFVPIFTYFSGTKLNTESIFLLKELLIVTAVSIFLCFLIGELTNNNSQVDKLWSILPIIYIWIIAYHGDFEPKYVLMGVLVTLWGARLTYNFSLKGAYRWRFWEGDEHYRWQVLRAKPEFQPKWKWTLFNLFFICTYQNLLILLFTLPALVVFQNGGGQINSWDIIISLFVLGFIIYETVADRQHWNYQSTKWAKIKANEKLEVDYEKGFLDKGLWSLSRHPNYFAEQMIWICFYFFSVVASGLWINWSIMGALLLVLLFQGSANFSEEISAKKYPHYGEYQKKVGKFIPYL
jgi:steroid 5-alpha reductase family enzyme